MSEQIPKILDKYLIDGPIVNWITGWRLWIQSLCILSSFLAVYFLQLSTLWIVGLAILCIIGVPLIAATLLFLVVPESVRAEELEEHKRVGSSGTYVKNKNPTVVKGKKFIPSPEQVKDICDITSETIREYAFIYLETNNEAVKEQVLEKIQDCLDLLKPLGLASPVTWIELYPSEDYRDHVFHEEAVVNLANSWFCFNTKTGELKEFELVTGWENGTILTAPQLTQKVNALPGAKLFIEDVCLFEEDGEESSAPISCFYSEKI